MADLNREDLWRLYEGAVEEYRFQVKLNAERFQWLVGIDVAVVTVGAGLLRLGNDNNGHGLSALVFLAGLVIAVFTAVADRQQHGYYRAARDRVGRLGRALGVEEWSVDTTPGFRAEAAPAWSKIRTIRLALVSALGTLNLFGLGWLAFR